MILDEVHDRAAEADFLCLVVRNCLLQDTECKTKVVLMSATLESSLYSKYFAMKGLDVAEPICIEGRQFSVDNIFIDNLVKYDKSTLFQQGKSSTVAVLPNLEAVRKAAIRQIEHQSMEFTKNKKKLTVQLIPNDPRVEICCDLILAAGSLGEGILVFLPGLNDMMMLYDTLNLKLKLRNVEEYFKVFILHSEVPMNEQREAHKPPAADVTHVIIATSVAESSLTIPKLRLVINFCLRKQIQYSAKRNLSILQLQWCSQASCRQRGGRVGRVFPGTAVHLVTKQHHDDTLPPFDDPEMVKSSLVRLLLEAKVLCTFIPYERPSSLLKDTLSPPSCTQLQDAVSILYKSGGITKECEKSSKITTLGHFCLSLPLDLNLCKLILFGICFACPTEAIVMAAGLSLRNDVFSIPFRPLMNDKKYRDSLWNSTETRWKYDQGQFSEPIMYLNLFKAWYRFRCSSASANGQSREDTAEMFLKLPQNKGISSHRLLDFENTVNNIASRTNRFIPPQSKLHDSISALTKTKQVIDSVPEGMTPMKVQFLADPTKLKCLLVAAFPSNLLQGIRNCEDMTSYGDEDQEIMKVASAEDIDLTSKNMLFMEPMTKAQKMDQTDEVSPVTEEDLTRVVHFISESNFLNSTVKINFVSRSKFKKIVTINFANIKEMRKFANVQNYIVEKDALLSSSATIFWQYGLRSKYWAVKNLQNLPRPRHPCSIAWYQIPEHGGERNYIIAGGKRNPSGALCDTQSSTPFIAVVATLLGSGRSTLGSGITVLPRLGSAALTRSLFMVLTFLNFQTDVAVQKTLDQKGFCVFTVNGEKFDYSGIDNVAISVEDVARMNAIRQKLSEVVASCTQQLPLKKMEGIAECIHWLLYRKQEVVIHTDNEGTADTVAVPTKPMGGTDDAPNKNFSYLTSDVENPIATLPPTIQAYSTVGGNPTVDRTQHAKDQMSLEDSTASGHPRVDHIAIDNTEAENIGTGHTGAESIGTGHTGADTTITGHTGADRGTTVTGHNGGGHTGADTTVTGHTGAGHTGADSTVTGYTGVDTTVTGHTGAGHTVTIHTETDSTVTIHTGADSTVTSHTGADSTVTSHTGADSTITGHTVTIHTGADSTITIHIGADSTVTIHTGADSTVTGHTGADSTVTGHTGADSTVTGHTGADSTVTIHTGADGTGADSTGADGTAVDYTQVDSTASDMYTVEGSTVSNFTEADNTVTEDPIAKVNYTVAHDPVFVTSPVDKEDTRSLSSTSDCDDASWVTISEPCEGKKYVLFPPYGQGTLFPLKSRIEIRSPNVVSPTSTQEQKTRPEISLRPSRFSCRKQSPVKSESNVTEAVKRLQNITAGNVTRNQFTSSIFHTRAGESIDVSDTKSSVSVVFGNTVSPEASSDESDDDEMYLEMEFAAIKGADIPLWSQRLVYATVSLCVKSKRFEITTNKVLNKLFLKSCKKKMVVHYLKCVPSIFSLHRYPTGDSVRFKFKSTPTLKPQEKEDMKEWMKEHRSYLDCKMVEKYSKEYLDHDRQSGIKDVRPLQSRIKPLATLTNPFALPRL